MTDLLTSPKHIFDEEEHHEFYWLLADTYPSLGKRQRKGVLAALFEATPPKSFRSKRQADDATRSRRLRLLSAIRESLSTEESKMLDSLLMGSQPPDNPDFLVRHEGGFTGSAFPSRDLHLGRMSPSEFLEFESNWSPGGGFTEPGEEELAGALKGLVSRHPQDYAGEAAIFAQPRLCGIYAHAFLASLTEAVKVSGGIEFGPVFSLCGSLLDLRDDEIPLGPRGYGFRPAWLRGAIADFLKEAVTRDEFAPPASEAPVILEILKALLLKSADSPEPGTLGDPDPTSTARNSTLGKSLEALFMYALWRTRELSRSAQPETSQLEPEVKVLLERFIDCRTHSWPPSHALFGKWLGLLCWIDSPWILGNWRRLFPDSENEAACWAATLSGLVLYGRPPLEEFYPLLREEFRRALEEAVSFADRRPDATLGNVADYIAIAYYAGWESLQPDDSLIRAVFSSTVKAVRSSFIETLGRDLKELKPTSNDEAWKRLKALWEWRMTGAKGDHDLLLAEATRFSWWLEAVPEDLEACFDVVLATVQNLSGEEPRARYILQYLAAQSNHYASKAVLILDTLTERPIPTYVLGMESDSVRQVLEQALGADSEARQVAMRVINRFGEAGDHRFRDLLN